MRAQKELLAALLSRKVDGIIWAIPEIGSHRQALLEQIEKINVPVVFINMQPAPDLAVVAIGAGANPLLPTTTPGLELNKRGYIVADLETGKTSKKGVFAGGDIVIGAATVILAMGAGRKAAAAMHQYLTNGVW